MEENNSDRINKFENEINKLKGYQAQYGFLQQQMPFINSGIDKMELARDALNSPYGNNDKIQTYSDNIINAWSIIPEISPNVGIGVTGSYGITSSGCAEVYNAIVENVQFDPVFSDQFKSRYITLTNNDNTCNRIELLLNNLDNETTSTFKRSTELYSTWKVNPNDLRNVATEMRNTLEKYKGNLWRIRNKEENTLKNKGEFSWNKTIDSLGKKNKSLLLKEKERYLKLHSQLSEILKGISKPNSTEFEEIYLEYLTHLDSVFPLLDHDIKKKYFNID